MTDPHKVMLKRSKRLAKKMRDEKEILKKGKKSASGKDKNFDYGGRMFSAEAWKAD